LVLCNDALLKAINPKTGGCLLYSLNSFCAVNLSEHLSNSYQCLLTQLYGAVVNCVQSHPFDCAVATSGIDNTIKVWTPYTREPSMVAGGEVGLDTVDSSRVMAENQLQMQRHREIGL
jgi:WD40 repeat protein